MRRALPPLYAIVDPLDTGRDPVALADALLAGGARVLQLRLKQATPRTLYALAAAIHPRARAADALFLVNDRPDIARAVGADGVHLGQDDVPLAVARQLLGPDALIGISTHDVAEATAAANAGADYIGVGPVYETATKERSLPARGLALVRTVRAAVASPIVAIGGITPDTAPDVLAAGATSVAMIGALVRSPDVSATVRDLRARLRR
jgi:thiamine-phosphate pyrophosphorylase